MTQPGRHTVRDADAAVHDLLDRYRADCAEARNRIMANNAMPSDSRATAINEAVAALRQQYAAELDGIDTSVRGQVTSLQTRATGLLPTPAAGVEALLTRQAWFARIMTLLNSGWTFRQVVDSARDPEMLHALADELPTMFDSNQVSLQGGLPTGQKMIANQLARLAGPSAVAAMAAADDAGEGLAVLEPSLTQARHEIGATDHRTTSEADFADALAQYGLRTRGGRYYAPGA
jgi:hypothetical protein